MSIGSRENRIFIICHVELLKSFLDLPLDWIPTTWIYKGGDLRYALNYGEIRFDVLQQFFADSASEWSHKGEGN